jgi:hypothetical protein
VRFEDKLAVYAEAEPSLHLDAEPIGVVGKAGLFPGRQFLPQF